MCELVTLILILNNVKLNYSISEIGWKVPVGWKLSERAPSFNSRICRLPSAASVLKINISHVFRLWYFSRYLQIDDNKYKANTFLTNPEFPRVLLWIPATLCWLIRWCGVSNRLYDEQSIAKYFHTAPYDREVVAFLPVCPEQLCSYKSTRYATRASFANPIKF